MINNNSAAEDESRTFIEGLDFYYANGLMVLTRHYLLERGFCCDSGCRHCPYKDEAVPLEQEDV